jgi:hypothetical protein
VDAQGAGADRVRAERTRAVAGVQAVLVLLTRACDPDCVPRCAVAVVHRRQYACPLNGAAQPSFWPRSSPRTGA